MAPGYARALTSQGRSIADLWLPEPTQRTLAYVRDGTVRIVERVASALSAIWTTGTTGWVWPADKWDLARRDDAWRVTMAADFGGFEPDYPAPPPAQLRLHRDSAVRAVLAQQLLEHLGGTTKT